MSYATTYCRAALGIDAPLVTVETHLANGLPSFSIVGLPEKAVQEARDRVRSALINSHFEFPSRRITVNLAPADLPKQGSRFDLSIAIGILAASGQLPAEAAGQCELLGELSLAGALRPIHAVLPAALAALARGRALVLPTDNGTEAALVQALTVLPARHLLDVTAHLQGSALISPLEVSQPPAKSPQGGDLDEVHGQAQARRALEIAAAGRLNLLMMGPPGSGKSMLASRLPGILPPLSEAEALETAAVRSVAGLGFDAATWFQRPFRGPHHTSSAAALVGGGADPRPGEISLAHNGVLFLDELAEFPSNVLDGLREPLETRHVLISRAARQAIYPADFQLVGAMNPCKCGYALDPQRACASCSPVNTERYQRRLSGPLRDRIDLQIEVPAVDHATLVTGLREPAESSATVAERVAAAWQRQRDRQGTVNSRLDQGGLNAHCRLPPNGEALLETAVTRLHLSARAFHRVLRVARTIADLEDAAEITIDHLAEAISLRRLAVSRV